VYVGSQEKGLRVNRPCPRIRYDISPDRWEVAGTRTGADDFLACLGRLKREMGNAQARRWGGTRPELAITGCRDSDDDDDEKEEERSGSRAWRRTAGPGHRPGPRPDPDPHELREVDRNHVRMCRERA
jgi:hypothetical protein